MEFVIIGGLAAVLQQSAYDLSFALTSFCATAVPYTAPPRSVPQEIKGDISKRDGAVKLLKSWRGKALENSPGVRKNLDCVPQIFL